MPGRRCSIHLAALGLLASLASAAAATNLSTWVYPGPTGKLLHQRDPLGNRLLDYTAVGYKGGTETHGRCPRDSGGSRQCHERSDRPFAESAMARLLTILIKNLRGAFVLNTGI